MPGFTAVTPFSSLGIYGSAPAYDRIQSVPSWLPPIGTSELEQQYRNTNQNFDTSQYDTAAEAQRGRILGTALNAGTAAAAEYANRARQAGGSGLGAGLVKAQAQVGAQKSAGDIELQRQTFDASQRAAAAAQAGQIATSLGSLRSQYLNSIVNYSTSEDKISADYATAMAGLLARMRRGGIGGGSASVGAGPGLDYQTMQQYMDAQRNNSQNAPLAGMFG